MMARTLAECLPEYILHLKSREANGLVRRGKIFKRIVEGKINKFDGLRRFYSLTDTNSYSAYVADWMPLFTPIEKYMWEEIRHKGLPFFPQFPIGRCFADFADPVRKIVIECDGAAYHVKERDAKRDRFMSDLGWTVFRISGSDCNRIIENPWETISAEQLERDSSEAMAIVANWAMNTADGFIASLREVVYRKSNPVEEPEAGAFYWVACDVLNKRLCEGCDG